MKKKVETVETQSYLDNESMILPKGVTEIVFTGTIEGLESAIAEEERRRADSLQRERNLIKEAWEAKFWGFGVRETFGQGCAFKFVVPLDYNDAKQLGNFAEERKQSFSKIYPSDNVYFDLTDDYLSEVSNSVEPLIPGETYNIVFWEPNPHREEAVTLKEFLEFIKTEKVKTSLIGAKGLSLVWQIAGHNFPKYEHLIGPGRGVMSLEKKDELSKGTKSAYLMSYIQPLSNKSCFYFREENEDWILKKDDCIITVRKW